MNRLRFALNGDLPHTLDTALRRYRARPELSGKPQVILFHTGCIPEQLPLLEVKVAEDAVTQPGCIDVVGGDYGEDESTR